MQTAACLWCVFVLMICGAIFVVQVVAFVAAPIEDYFISRGRTDAIRRLYWVVGTAIGAGIAAVWAAGIYAAYDLFR